ncbi:MAG: tetratricopeptide repeat protein [Bacteroidales bacterium]|jgi:tetratricopeptide (TPR) repeat protein|nr:tetratricopeptide repeat protein [Bacteroidales bacterium]
MKKYIYLAMILAIAIASYFLFKGDDTRKMTASDYSNEALKLNKEGHIHDAILNLDKAIEKKKNDPVLLYNRGTLYLKQNKYDKAINDFSASLKIDKKNFGALQNRGKA